MMHWTTFVLAIIAILVFGFVAVLAIATKLDIETKKAATMKAMADYAALVKATGETKKTTKKTTTKKKAGRPSTKSKKGE